MEVEHTVAQGLAHPVEWMGWVGESRGLSVDKKKKGGVDEEEEEEEEEVCVCTCGSVGCGLPVR